jgi:hypothetical protein
VDCSSQPKSSIQPECCPVQDRDNSIDDVGPLIFDLLNSQQRSKKIENTWQTSFGQARCPLCDRHDKIVASMSEERRGSSSSWGQADEPRNLEIRHSLDCHTADSQLEEWVWRGLSRLRQHSPDDESVTLKPETSEYPLVEELFAYDCHVLRHGLGISDAYFARSMGDLRGINPGGGKSKARFAISLDGNFILKSISAREDEFLRRFGPSLYQYYGDVLFQHRPSVLVPILGIFSLCRPSWKSRMTLVVMPNLAREKPSAFYDLKGVGMRRKLKGDSKSKPIRSAKDDLLIRDDVSSKSMEVYSDSDSVTLLPLPESVTSSASEVLWDQEFREWCRNDRVILEADSFTYLRAALEYDTQFLSNHQVIDYSLLTCVHCPYSDSPSILVGIIDFLGPFTWDKKLESVVKSVNSNIAQLGNFFSSPDGKANGACEMPDAPTVIRPDLYAKRFVSNIIALFNLEDVDPT